MSTGRKVGTLYSSLCFAPPGPVDPDALIDRTSKGINNACVHVVCLAQQRDYGISPGVWGGLLPTCHQQNCPVCWLDSKQKRCYCWKDKHGGKSTKRAHNFFVQRTQMVKSNPGLLIWQNSQRNGLPERVLVACQQRNGQAKVCFEKSFENTKRRPRVISRRELGLVAHCVACLITSKVLWSSTSTANLTMRYA